MKIKIELEDVVYGRLCGMVKNESIAVWKLCGSIVGDAIEAARNEYKSDQD